MGQGSVRRISLGVFCMAPTQGYHHNQMQVGNVRDPRPSKNGIRIQTEVHLLLDYEKQYWNKRVESVLHLRNTAVRVRSAPQKPQDSGPGVSFYLLLYPFSSCSRASLNILNIKFLSIEARALPILSMICSGLAIRSVICLSVFALYTLIIALSVRTKISGPSLCPRSRTLLQMLFPYPPSSSMAFILSPRSSLM